MSTGTTNVDRYLPFTNYAVINTNVNSPDVVASGGGAEWRGRGRDRRG